MYGEDRNIRLFVGLGLVILLLFVAIILIVNHGGSKGKVAETKKPLTSYVDDSNVTITQQIIGPIKAAEDHDQGEISVTNTATTATRISGYDGNVVDSVSYAMTNSAFSEFLHALNSAGFTLGNSDEALSNDQGLCPTGKRYIYTIREGADVVQRFWATSCGGTKTYKGNLSLTVLLFKAQVPDYTSLMSGTGL
jgi:hypothetical protein